MRRAARFLLALLAGLAVLTLVGYFALSSTIRDWFESDLAMRSQLAVNAARRSLADNWRGDPERLVETLDDIAHDERILGAAACATDGTLLAATDGYPRRFSCAWLFTRIRRDGQPDAPIWSGTAQVPSGRVHLSAIHVDGDAGNLGAVVLVHDLSYLGRRDATTRDLLFVAFFILALGASFATLLAARFARKGWTRDLRRALRGQGPEELRGQASGEFQPLLRDVRGLAERLARENEGEARGGAWSAKRLRATLTQYLQGERVVILANREPYVHEKVGEGVRVLHPASGLVSALEPVMRACSGVWVAHGGGTADRETVDAKDRVRVPPGEESYLLRRVWLTEEEENGYYYGFSNEGLWPLCHLAHERPIFRAEDWQHYVHVNRKFADAVCAEVDSDDPIVLVQDYHFALAPKMIRERLPRATIITFWHIPWPNAERIGICPWREELLSGLLGSSVVGFHTQQHCNNFIESVDAFMESRIDREATAVFQGSRKTLVRPYPISIEWPVHWLKEVPPVAEARVAVRRELGLPEDALLGVGIDRLDYTKGIEERLSAIDELLQRNPEFRGRFSFVQVAAPSRTKIKRYRELNDRVEALTAEINAKWASGSYRPIVLLRAHHEPTTVFRYYRAAELCYVSSLHDGMNLVAKEFVAARDDELGVLVLSQFTGAARDLTEALIVNPYDIRQAGAALAAALRMPASEQRVRMQSMRRLVSEFNVYRWAGRMLVDAAELRRKERMSGRLSPVALVEV
ncbi:MAG TPA: trehalose-6-phosphate synthase [Polyangiaceae bacterium]|jgi:trehalose 6-phosphate synthase|nr:trehalose-6-phosphate synthase [Polyangiaceae bacterium]